MNSWNAIGGELLYYTSNVTCQAWRDIDYPHLEINKYDIDSGATHAITNNVGTICLEAWGISCIQYATINYDSADITWYTGTGTPPAGSTDFWTYMLHEFGHTMWCNNHSNNTADVMYHTYDGVDRTLSAADRECYTHYYGTTN